ncbi:MAG TPA: hypothetical protein DCK76_06150 [Desulfotomaculum sp.]|nr:hypothetical protein [Desulfotomaculum sp.]HBY04321.1 hypothetical protein [Desulfotomaculum sp.]
MLQSLSAKDGKKYRALDVTGKDLALLRAIADPKFNVDAISNKQLQKTLSGQPWAKDMEGLKTCRTYQPAPPAFTRAWFDKETTKTT